MSFDLVKGGRGMVCPYPNKSSFEFHRAVWGGVKIPPQYNDPRQGPMPGWIPSVLFSLGGCSILGSLIAVAMSPVAGAFGLVTGAGMVALAAALGDREEKLKEHPQLAAVRRLFAEYCDFCDLGDRPKALQAFGLARELAWLPWREHQKALGLQYETTGPLATVDAAETLAAYEEVGRRVWPTIEQ